MLRTIMLLVCLAVLMAAPLPVAALDCAPELAIEHVDLVVRGKVIAIEQQSRFFRPKRRQVQLEVAKYHKGSGPRILVGYLAGLDDGNPSWMNSATVGEDMLASFRYEGKDLVSRPCYLWMVVWADGLIPEHIAKRLGPARDPQPGGPTVTDRSFPWWPLAATVAGGAMGFWYARRRRATKNPKPPSNGV